MREVFKLDLKKFNENLKFIAKSSFNTRIDFNIGFPHDSNYKQVILADGFATTLIDTYKILKPILTTNHCKFAHLCSQVYFRMRLYCDWLLSQHRYMDAILFWQKIEEITSNWEENEKWEENNKKLHKGSLYGFIAKTYLCIGDLEKGFTYFSNALNADCMLYGIVKDYPERAPSNLTLSLSDDKDNFMLDFTTSIREWLDGFFEHPFCIKDLEDLLLKKVEPKEIKLFFVWSIWNIYESKKIRDAIKTNNFNILRNLECLFNLCLVIESLLLHFVVDTNGEAKSNLNNNTLGALLRIFLSGNEEVKCDYDKLKKFKNPDLQKMYDSVLNDTTKLKEARYLFIAYLIRNYGGHNLQPLNLFVSKFDDIVRILLFDILYILDSYKKK